MRQWRTIFLGVRPLLAGSAALALLPAHSLADPAISPGPDQLATCQNDQLAPEERAAVCTRLIEDATQLDGVRAEALLNRGLVLEKQSEPAKAIADYSQAIKLNPTYPALYRTRGLAYVVGDQSSNAVSDFSELIKLEPTDIEALFLRAQLLLDGGQPDSARADYARILELNPTDADAYVGYAEVDIAKTDLKKAAEDFRKALELEPDNDAAKSGLQRLELSL